MLFRSSENMHNSPGIIALTSLKKKGLILSRTSSIPTFPGSCNSVTLTIEPSAPPPESFIYQPANTAAVDICLIVTDLFADLIEMDKK